jgi:ferredoxin-type protein NapH
MRKSQWIRHGVQTAVLLGLVLLPAATWWHHRAIIGSDAGPDHTQRLAVQGNTWALKIGSLPVLDPLAAVESTVARRALWPKLLLGILLPVLATLLLGRVFCSWICPAGLLFELSQYLRTGLKKLGFSPREVRRPPERFRYHLLVVGLAVAGVTGIPVLLHLYPPGILARETHRATTALLNGQGLAVTGGILFILALVAIELTLCTRFWCRYVCPGGALYSLLGMRRLVRVRYLPGACTKCMDCVRACPMGLNPSKGLMGAACDNCLACVSVCNDDALPVVFSTHDQPPEPAP